MSRKSYLRLLALSLLAALILSVVSMLLLTALTEQAAKRPRNDFLIFFSSSIEDRLNGVKDFSPANLVEILKDDHLGPFGPPPQGPGIRPPFASGHMGTSGFRPPPGRPPGPHFSYWLINQDNQIIFTSTHHGVADPHVPDMVAVPHPTATHEIVATASLWPTNPTLSVIRLTTTPALFLVVREEPGPFVGTLLKTQAALTFATVLAALLIALSLMFIYLQRKSAEARSVLKRLGEGDLAARFEIRKFDEFGGLMGDFNRMAGEIEHLVGRIRETETVRKNLLQELGHDLRTPLTSLSTSFETLQTHGEKMPPEIRADLFSMIGAEISYFKDLLEKLMTIASLDEPHYKQSSEAVDFSELVAGEVRTLINTSPSLTWHLESEHCLRVLGDEHLLQRLLRNAFENAARYARTRVTVKLYRDREMVIVSITDDGPGLSDEDLELFGKRREKRRPQERRGALNFSLGLGSVIMKAITQLHHGQIKIENLASQNENSGARLLITLPLIDDKSSSAQRR